MALMITDVKPGLFKAREMRLEKESNQQKHLKRNLCFFLKNIVLSFAKV